jgi:magnesium chelatase family protein
VLAAVASATLTGAIGRSVLVEVHVSNGLPGFTIVGLPDAAVREARDRVRAAILCSGLSWPLRRVTINLAPAGFHSGNHWLTRVKKSHSLPVAAGMYCNTGSFAG